MRHNQGFRTHRVIDVETILVNTQAAIKNGISADQLVLIAIALFHGLMMHHLMDPRHYPDHLITPSSELVFDKLMGFAGK